MTNLKKKKINYKLSSVYGDGHKLLYKEIYKYLKKFNRILFWEMTGLNQ